MIEVKNVTKYYGDVIAVEKLSFTVPHGQIIGLLGRNGAGKSTTLRMITGFLEPSEGEVLIDDHSVSQDPVRVKEMVGYLPETAPLYKEMLVYDYLEFIGRGRGVAPRALPGEISRVASMCGIVEVMHKSISSVSKGYRQRVGLAMAMLKDPPVLILDEPISGLDPNQIVEIREIIKSIGRTKTIIFSTHILSQAESTCDRILIIDNGRLIADGAANELQGSRRDKLRLRLRGAGVDELNQAMIQASGIEIKELKAEGDQIELIIEGEGDLPAIVSPLIASRGWIILEMSQQKQSLEDVFLHLTDHSNI